MNVSKIDDARSILTQIGMPQQQRNDMCCYCLLALASISERSRWREACNEWIRIHDLMSFISSEYGITYAENSRETIRKQAMHKFRDAAIIEDNGVATNSPHYRYRLTDEAVDVLRNYGTSAWSSQLDAFKELHTSLIDLYSSQREMAKKPVLINGLTFTFSTGKHNQLQKEILEEFAPRFAENAMCLYVGDSTNRDMYKDTVMLSRLGFEITQHDIMPDVVLYRADKNWIYFIEAVTSVGPMSQERVNNILKMTENVTAGLIFVTAFPDRKTFRMFMPELAWETEVWISSEPDHMIHLNGDRFMGPRY